MSSLWVVLIDVSGSMDEGFSGVTSSDPLAERGRWRTKLEAAKDLLLKQVATSRVQDVAVFSFADEVNRIFHGARSDFAMAETTIRALVTDGKTNLARGLTAVFEDRGFESYKALSVLILSDGLSNVGDPVAAAELLIEKYPYCRIDTILIDESDQGRRIAEDVSINGSVRPALSIIDLDKALDSARASSLRQELAGFALRRLDLQSELALLADIGSPTLLSITTPVELTTESLRNDIVPTLEGLESLQRAASEVSGTPYQAIISSISQDSPISISLTGLKEAVELALDWVIPWRRKNAEILSTLKLRQQEIENEKASIQNRQLRVSLVDSEINLAKQMLETLDRHHLMSDRHRQRLLQQFVTGIDQMSKTSIEFKALDPKSGDDNRLTIH